MKKHKGEAINNVDYDENGIELTGSIEYGYDMSITIGPLQYPKKKKQQ